MALFSICTLVLRCVLSLSVLTAAGTAPNPPARIHLTTLGDSITWGAGASNRQTTAYADLLAKHLHARLTNLGIGGETLIPEPNHVLTGRLRDGTPYAAHRGILADEVPEIPLDTNIVTIYIGTNDLWLTEMSTKLDFSNIRTLYPQIAQAFAHNMDTLVRAIRKRVPHAEIVIATNINHADKGSLTEFTAGPYYYYRRSLTSLTNRMNAAIAREGTSVADLHCDPQLYDVSNYITAVDVHPNDRGHARIAHDFLEAIKHRSKAKHCLYDRPSAPIK